MRIARSIPRSISPDEQVVDLPDEWDQTLDAPLVVEELVVLAGRWGRPPGPGRAPLLVAFDRSSGDTAWTVRVPEATPWLASSAPVLCPDGTIRIVYWTLQGPMRVLTVSANGTLESVDETSAESGVLVAWWPLPYPPPAQLDAMEIRLSARGKKGGHVLSIRLAIPGGAPIARSDYRRDGHTVWTDGEWLLGETNGVAICEDFGAFGRRVIGRNRLTGQRLWSGQLGLERRGVIAVRNGEVLFLDERDRENAREARAEAYRMELIRTEQNIPWRDFAHARPLTTPASVVAVDATNGNEAWRWEIPGDVHGFLLGPHVAIAATAGLAPAIRVVQRGGTEMGVHTLAGPAAPEPLLQPEERVREGGGPRPVAVDHTHVLWIDRGELVCALLGEIGRTVWHRKLPGECRAPAVAGAGDVYRSSITAADDRVFLVDRGRLFIWRGE